MTSIVAKWQSLTKKEKTEGEGKKMGEGNAEQTDNKNEVPGNNGYTTYFYFFLFLSVL